MGCVLLALSLSGCILLAMDSNKKDGEHCESSEDCASENCMGNICVGTSCSDNSDCAANFSCYHYDGDPIFDIGDHNACRLMCDAQGECPAQWKCFNADRYCSYVGPTVTISVSNDHPQGHEVVTFTGTIDPSPSDVTWTWNFDTLGTKTGSSVEMSFAPGYWSWSVDATTPGGGEHYESGSVFACAVVGDACEPYAGDCCGQLSCNPSTKVCE